MHTYVVEKHRCKLLFDNVSQISPAVIGSSSVLRCRQHSIGYMEDGFYRSKDPTNSIKVLKEDLQKTKQTTKTTKYTCTDNNRDTKGYTQNKHNKSPKLQ